MKYYLTKMQHSPTTLCLTDKRILELSGDCEGNWALHNEGDFFMERPIVSGTIADIQKYIKGCSE